MRGTTPHPPRDAGAARPGWRRRVWALLEDHTTSSNRLGAYAVETALAAVILLNCAALILWTVPGLRAAYAFWFQFSEYATIIVFTLEYGLRVWTSPENNPQNPAWRQRWRFVRSLSALVDLAALAVSSLGVFWLLFDDSSPNLTFLLAVRLLTRSTKLMRYFPAGRRVGRAVLEKRGQLLTAVVAMLIVLVIASSLMYLAENKTQPEDFPSIPGTMWWGMVTLTTVGYGDIVPVTPAGRILAAVIAVLGIGLFALPAGIISSGLLETEGDDQPAAANADANADADADTDTAQAHYCRHCPHCARQRRRSSRKSKSRRRLTPEETAGAG